MCNSMWIDIGGINLSLLMAFYLAQRFPREIPDKVDLEFKQEEFSFYIWFCISNIAITKIG